MVKRGDQAVMKYQERVAVQLHRHMAIRPELLVVQDGLAFWVPFVSAQNTNDESPWMRAHTLWGMCRPQGVHTARARLAHVGERAAWAAGEGAPMAQHAHPLAGERIERPLCAHRTPRTAMRGEAAGWADSARARGDVALWRCWPCWRGRECRLSALRWRRSSCPRCPADTLWHVLTRLIAPRPWDAAVRQGGGEAQWLSREVCTSTHSVGTDCIDSMPLPP